MPRSRAAAADCHKAGQGGDQWHTRSPASRLLLLPPLTPRGVAKGRRHERPAGQGRAVRVGSRRRQGRAAWEGGSHGAAAPAISRVSCDLLGARSNAARSLRSWKSECLLQAGCRRFPFLLPAPPRARSKMPGPCHARSRHSAGKAGLISSPGTKANHFLRPLLLVCCALRACCAGGHALQRPCLVAACAGPGRAAPEAPARSRRRGSRQRPQRSGSTPTARLCAAQGGGKASTLEVDRGAFLFSISSLMAARCKTGGSCSQSRRSCRSGHRRQPGSVGCRMNSLACIPQCPSATPRLRYAAPQHHSCHFTSFMPLTWAVGRVGWRVGRWRACWGGPGRPLRARRASWGGASLDRARPAVAKVCVLRGGGGGALTYLAVQIDLLF